jgi:FrmR/RcnR family transcriptional regulator, repressor of frmRAB operon
MHTTHSKEKLVLRARRIVGQVKAIEKAIAEDKECTEVIHLLSACHGALNGLMSELVEDHILFHVLSPKGKATSKQVEAAEQLMDVVKTYLR